MRSLLIEGLKPNGDASIFVDIGGSMDRILRDLQKDAPQYTGRLVLQEIPRLWRLRPRRASIPTAVSSCRSMTFSPRGPLRAYFMRSVLRDWPDGRYRNILAHLEEAIEPGYSKIVITDYVHMDVIFPMSSISSLSQLPPSYRKYLNELRTEY